VERGSLGKCSRGLKVEEYSGVSLLAGVVQLTFICRAPCECGRKYLEMNLDSPLAIPEGLLEGYKSSSWVCGRE
jgi:hypothetical protein